MAMSEPSDIHPANMHWDWIIVGSGFGGSVSALRLAEKGYRVLVLEKGKRWEKDDFPKTNWDLKRWMHNPALGLHGFFQMSFLKHITVLHGVGVGGGSLVYANTLARPKADFYHKGSWAHLEDWIHALAPHYQQAEKMLGASEALPNTPGDEILRGVAQALGKPQAVRRVKVAVYQGEPGTEVDDPYFGSHGPKRVGCTGCGACMTGCRVGAKNTLDKNYLYLAEAKGVVVLPEHEVTVVQPHPIKSNKEGYSVTAMHHNQPVVFSASRVIFSGGVMGTVPLLLKLKETTLPNLSSMLGHHVRTNNEALVGVIAPDDAQDFSKGMAITSMLETDEHSHLEPVRYGAGSGFFRLMAAPYAPGTTWWRRLIRLCTVFARSPLAWIRSWFGGDFSKRTLILLYMRSIESTLSLSLSRSWFSKAFGRGLQTSARGDAPTAMMPEMETLVEQVQKKMKGVSMSLFTETLLGTPSTAHILGGCVMGENALAGVVDKHHRVFGYPELYVIDGSAVSANPGVNPSLTITAMAERAMETIDEKNH